MPKATKTLGKQGLTPRQLEVYNIIKDYIEAASIVIYLLKCFFYFVTGYVGGATVTHLLINSYISTLCYVAPMCHYSRRRKALFCFLENKMSKYITIPGVYGW